MYDWAAFAMRLSPGNGIDITTFALLVGGVQCVLFTVHYVINGMFRARAAKERAELCALTVDGVLMLAEFQCALLLLCGPLLSDCATWRNTALTTAFYPYAVDADRMISTTTAPRAFAAWYVVQGASGFYKMFNGRWKDAMTTVGFVAFVRALFEVYMNALPTRLVAAMAAFHATAAMRRGSRFLCGSSRSALSGAAWGVWRCFFVYKAFLSRRSWSHWSLFAPLLAMQLWHVTIIFLGRHRPASALSTAWALGWCWLFYEATVVFYPWSAVAGGISVFLLIKGLLDAFEALRTALAEHREKKEEELCWW